MMRLAVSVALLFVVLCNASADVTFEHAQEFVRRHSFKKADSAESTQTLFEKFMLEKHYDASTPPEVLTSGQRSLTIAVVLNRVYALQQSAQQFSVDMEVYAIWQDNCALDFEFPNYALSLWFPTEQPHVMWYPNLWFPTIRQIVRSDETSAGVNEMFVLMTNGNQYLPTSVLYRRITGTVTCSMNFRQYPFDAQSCTIPIVVYEAGMGAKVVMKSFLQAPAPGYLSTFATSYSFQPRVNYSHVQYNPSNSSQAFGPQAFNAMVVTVDLKRDGAHYVVLVFLPLSLITFCGLCSLFVDVTVPPARVGLSVTSMLSLVALNFAFTSGLPDAPYENFLTMYNLICLVFVFSTIPSFVVVHMLKKFHDAKPKTPQALKPSDAVTVTISSTANLVPVTKPWPPLWVLVDRFLAGFIVLGFLTCVLVYFAFAGVSTRL